MKHVAIIGGGIVGVTTAYILTKNNVKVTLYDAGFAQGTRAAVGIICPWVSQRRNKAWYALASEGAEFLHHLAKEFPNQTFYKQNGTLITHDKHLERLYELALQRRENAPLMGRVELVDGDSLLPIESTLKQALFIEGGAQIDGQRYIDALLAASNNLEYVKKRVRVENSCIEGVAYDAIVVACGPWVNEVIDEQFAVYPQKGQCIEFDNMFTQKQDFPVIMPQGEIDVLFSQQGIVIGASHENDKGFDVTRDAKVEHHLKEQATTIIPGLAQHAATGYRVGLRAYTKNFTPFFGRVGNAEIYVASGLGSSGLTTGPLIGNRLAQAILTGTLENEGMNPNDFLVFEDNDPINHNT